MNGRGASRGLFFADVAYRRWFAADTASAAGLALRGIAVSMVAYQISGSTALAGLLGTLSQVVQQAAAVFGGTLIDRHDRRTLVVLNAAVSGCGWLVVCVLLISGRLSYLAFLIVCCLLSMINGLLGKATEAMLRSIVSVERYPQARSINEGRDATVSMAGGPVGGLLYAMVPFLPFLTMTALYAIAGASALCIPSGKALRGRQQGAEESDSSDTAFLHDLIEGWKWTVHQRLLVSLVAVACLMNFGINGMLYAIQLHLVSNGTNPARIGLIDTGTGIVILCGSLISTRIATRMPVGIALICTLACYTVCMAPMLFTDNYTIVLLCSSAAFLPFPLFNATAMGFIFAKTPVALQGRVSTAVSIPAQALSMFTQLLAGLLLPVGGFGMTMFVFVIAVVAALMIVLIAPRLRSIPSAQHWGSSTL
ncbi:MFS transporter [Bifidobacterium aquikefiricola]|uniref:MFS transporter n=1 Tax=Bifidobacterium aquikefiricola TaxID=3059038 RepID=A0AB39U5L5_9BIFI